MKNIKRYVPKRAKLSPEYARNNDETSYADFKMDVMVHWARKVVSTSTAEVLEKQKERHSQLEKG